VTERAVSVDFFAISELAAYRFYSPDVDLWQVAQKAGANGFYKRENEAEMTNTTESDCGFELKRDRNDK
jgi:hypothetical protein